jgi:hypothetical protein
MGSELSTGPTRGRLGCRTRSVGWKVACHPRSAGRSEVQPVTRIAVTQEAELATERGKRFEAAGGELRMHVWWAVGVVSTLLWLLDRAEVPMRTADDPGGG